MSEVQEISGTVMAESVDGIPELRAAVADLHRAIDLVRDSRGVWKVPQPAPPGSGLLPQSNDWNFTTYDRYISQRFVDMSLNLRERWEAQQIGLTAALAAAEKAVNAALIAAEKAVDKAESAQQLRNEVANEFRNSLADLSKLMWLAKDGQGAVESLRRELSVAIAQMGDRIGKVESDSANIQGRIWAISAVWAIITLGVMIGSRFIGH